jgi:LPXTG-motif cell wall-anchored protein
MTFRRALGCVLAGFALTLVPTAALAGEGYEGGDEALVVGDTTPGVGEPFRVVVNTDTAEATLTVTSQDSSVPDSDIEIAGTQSMTKATTAGAAEFTVTLHAAGRYDLVATDANGDQVGSAVVVVGAAAGGDTGDDGDEGALGGLGDTGMGSGTTLMLGAGVLLLVGGGAVMLVSRRRGDGQAA